MKQHEKKAKLLNLQSRSFIEGTVESINDQWVFFNNETEEASLLDDYLHTEIEVFHKHHWKKGLLLEDGKMKFSTRYTYCLQNNDEIRIRKELSFSFDCLLKELTDDVFIQFVTTLNSLQFSIYDCIHCFNQLMLVNESPETNGVNFLFFDNDALVCSVQHHFSYGAERIVDRFEFTLNTGKRMLVERISD